MTRRSPPLQSSVVLVLGVREPDAITDAMIRQAARAIWIRRSPAILPPHRMADREEIVRAVLPFIGEEIVRRTADRRSLSLFARRDTREIRRIVASAFPYPRYGAGEPEPICSRCEKRGSDCACEPHGEFEDGRRG